MQIPDLMFYYFTLINVLSILFMHLDKRRALKGKWRIPERTLFLLAFLGGSLGIYIGMKIFHHKTRHKSFRFGIPIIFLCQLAILLYFLKDSFPDLFKFWGTM